MFSLAVSVVLFSPFLLLLFTGAQNVWLSNACEIANRSFDRFIWIVLGEHIAGSCLSESNMKFLSSFGGTLIQKINRTRLAAISHAFACGHDFYIVFRFFMHTLICSKILHFRFVSFCCFILPFVSIPRAIRQPIIPKHSFFSLNIQHYSHLTDNKDNHDTFNFFFILFNLFNFPINKVACIKTRCNNEWMYVSVLVFCLLSVLNRRTNYIGMQSILTIPIS